MPKDYHTATNHNEVKMPGEWNKEQVVAFLQDLGEQFAKVAKEVMDKHCKANGTELMPDTAEVIVLNN